MTSQSLQLSIVVPVYRSEDCVEPLYEAIHSALVKACITFELILVNDCSPDRSWEKIEALIARSSHVVGVNLRKNFGQDAAIMAGLRLATGKYIAVMDDDLQHDPDDIPRLFTEIHRGKFDLVYANFEQKKQAWWKNLGSWFNGKLAEIVIKKPKSVYLSPYKLMTAGAISQVLNYCGPYPYLDGILFQITSRISQIPAQHRVRFAGEGNYDLIRSIRVWARLIFGFSVFPLRLMGFIGFLIVMLSMITGLAVICERLYDSTTPMGWASQILVPLFLGGVQLIFLGLIGEYLGRMRL